MRLNSPCAFDSFDLKQQKSRYFSKHTNNRCLYHSSIQEPQSQFCHSCTHTVQKPIPSSACMPILNVWTARINLSAKQHINEFVGTTLGNMVLAPVWQKLAERKHPSPAIFTISKLRFPTANTRKYHTTASLNVKLRQFSSHLFCLLLGFRLSELVASLARRAMFSTRWIAEGLQD